MKNKIENRSKFKYLYKILMKTFIIHLITIVLFIKYKGLGVTESYSIILAVFFSWFLFFALPTIILFINHTIKSKGLVFIMEDEKFTYINDKNICFEESDILKIQLYLSPPAYDRRIDFLFFGKYHYTNIILKDGIQIILPCLIHLGLVK